MSTKNKESKIPERKIKIFGTISFILNSKHTGIIRKITPINENIKEKY